MFAYGNSMYIYNHGIFSIQGYDVDAQAFITAASITDGTQKNAINQLVLDLKTANIWTKMKAIYPFVGGTASSHRFNLKAPTTNASDYYLTFVGGWTHSSTGALPDGTSGYASTNLIPSTHLNNYDSHLSYYSRTNNTSSSDTEIGCQDDTQPNPNQRHIYLRFGNQNVYSSQDADANVIITSSTDSRGFRLVSRTANNSLKAYLNGSSDGTNTVTSTADRPTIEITLGALNYKLSATTKYYGKRETAFATIGDGLTDTDATNLYNAIITFNTTLGRNI